MQTAEDKVKKSMDMSLDLDAQLPVRIWVEGDGKTYAEFQGNGNQRVPLSPYDVIQLVHKARVTVNRLISL